LLQERKGVQSILRLHVLYALSMKFKCILIRAEIWDSMYHMHTILCLPGTGKQRASFVDRYYQGICIGFLFVIYKAKKKCANIWWPFDHPYPTMSKMTCEWLPSYNIFTSVSCWMQLTLVGHCWNRKEQRAVRNYRLTWYESHSTVFRITASPHLGQCKAWALLPKKPQFLDFFIYTKNFVCGKHIYKLHLF